MRLKLFSYYVRSLYYSKCSLKAFRNEKQSVTIHTVYIFIVSYSGFASLGTNSYIVNTRFFLKFCPTEFTVRFVYMFVDI